MKFVQLKGRLYNADKIIYIEGYDIVDYDDDDNAIDIVEYKVVFEGCGGIIISQTEFNALMKYLCEGNGKENADEV